MNIEVCEVEPGRYVLKVLGLPCPYPTMYTIKTLEKIKEDEVLEVIFDNQPSSKTIQDAVVARGYKVLSVERLEEALWKIVVKKTHTKDDQHKTINIL
ncbi:MAG: sulfurtransferase TusA family protein [Aigarchaeota archaeon]|nr:sulfurtransferase TusA family protein [Aigarchaeota archaeon]MCX8192731.1 sulfurtransferase TusA family protein [Nitrososphaeria archaeon]MDW7985983.1 sulfurtransferase TusA family protein [Nitrososphaerota archaeon]